MLVSKVCIKPESTVTPSCKRRNYSGYGMRKGLKNMETGRKLLPKKGPKGWTVNRKAFNDNKNEGPLPVLLDYRIQMAHSILLWFISCTFRLLHFAETFFAFMITLDRQPWMSFLLKSCWRWCKDFPSNRNISSRRLHIMLWWNTGHLSEVYKARSFFLFNEQSDFCVSSSWIE